MPTTHSKHALCVLLTMMLFSACQCSEVARKSPDAGCDDCDASMDPCAASPCVNGTCAASGAGFVCTCDAGFEGPTCETRTGACAGDPCLHGGTCIADSSGFTCECVSGYDGPRCANYINECASQPCLNGGICVDGLGQFTCRCPAGFAGPTCAEVASTCADHPCQHGGICVDGADGYACECPPQFGGLNCELSCTITEDACTSDDASGCLDDADLEFFNYMADIIDVSANASTPYWTEPDRGRAFKMEERPYYAVRRQSEVSADLFPPPPLSTNPAVKAYVLHEIPNACNLGLQRVQSSSPEVRSVLDRIGTVYRYDAEKETDAVVNTNNAYAGIQMEQFAYPRDFPSWFPDNDFVHEDFHIYQVQYWDPLIDVSGYLIKHRVTVQDVALNLLWARVAADALRKGTVADAEDALKVILAIRRARETECGEIVPNISGDPDRFHYLTVQDKNMLLEGTAHYNQTRYCLESHPELPCYAKTVTEYADAYESTVFNVLEWEPTDSFGDSWYYFVLSYWHGSATGLLLDKVPGLDWKSPAGLPLTDPDAEGHQAMPGSLLQIIRTHYASIMDDELATRLAAAKSTFDYSAIEASVQALKTSSPEAFCGPNSQKWCCNDTYVP